MKTRTVADTYTIKTELVLPNDTNVLGNLMGGKLLHWMDIVTAIAAQRASGRTVVTVSVDFVDFKAPIKLGDLVTLEARVTRAFNTSIEVKVDVLAENLQTGNKVKSNSAYFTFVAVDQSGNTIPVNKIVPETEEEKSLYEDALGRRELRLALAGRINSSDAINFKEMFNR